MVEGLGNSVQAPIITDTIGVPVFAGNLGEVVSFSFFLSFFLKIDGIRNHIFFESHGVYCDYRSFQ